MREIMHQVFDNYISKTKDILTAIQNAENSKKIDIVSEMKQLLEIDASLQSALLQLKKHQEFQQKINDVSACLKCKLFFLWVSVILIFCFFKMRSQLQVKSDIIQKLAVDVTIFRLFINFIFLIFIHFYFHFFFFFGGTI